MTLLFVWFLTELGQAEGKVGLGETERLPGGQESNNRAGRGRRERPQGDPAGRAEAQTQNL